MKPLLPALVSLAAASFIAHAAIPKEQAAAGQQLFQSSGCTHCHGDKLQGTDLGPNLQGVGRQLKPAEITTQIHDGGKGMPPFGDILTGDQIEQIVAWLRTQKAKAPKVPKPAAKS